MSPRELYSRVARPRMDTSLPRPADPVKVRQWLTLSFVIYLVALVAGSWPRSVGDGGEYLAMSLNLGETGRPWLTDADIARVQAETASVPVLENWDIRGSTKTSPRYGTHDFVHFWFYSAAAQPFVSLARGLGASPIYGFAALNVGLLVLAFWVALPRLGGWLTWLVFAGPVIWWADKAHTEPFTFSLLTIAVLLLEEAPVWAVLAAGVAATQNPPIAGDGALRGRRARVERRGGAAPARRVDRAHRGVRRRLLPRSCTTKSGTAWRRCS